MDDLEYINNAYKNLNESHKAVEHHYSNIKNHYEYIIQSYKAGLWLLGFNIVFLVANVICALAN